MGRHNVEVLAYTKAVFNVSEPIEVKYVGGQPKVELPTLYVLSCLLDLRISLRLS